ncbi:MAG: diguanylate cyclase, partial [Desulfobacterales bacterium]|nr:diguanylate cyclase [Desulfobacterales bacterium]
DYFKRFNDTYGHQAGDECLREIASMIREGIKRPGDFAARYGGEEFVCLLPLTDGEGALHMADSIRGRLSDLHIVHAESDVSDCVTLSQGVASSRPAMGELPSELIRVADQALYTAKERGRDRIVLHSDA